MLQMGNIFVGFAFWNVVLFAVTIWLGLTHQSLHWQHQFTGALTGIYTCLTHCIVMMHFMGSGKGVKEAVAEYSLPNDPQTGFTRRSRKLHARASAMATMCCLLAITVVCLGGWTDTHKANVAAHRWHQWFAWFTVAFNLYGFRVEYSVIRAHTAIIREINALVQAKT
jgi:hypothetical protein